MQNTALSVSLVGLAYLVGSIPAGVVFSRRKYGIDVREMGSGNIGATNVTRVFGWYAGVLVFLLDLIKGLFPLWAIHKYFPQNPWLQTACAFALVLGHCFSVYLKFGGGKGVATSLGCLLVVAPLAAILSAFTYAALLLATRVSAVGSLGGIAVTFLYLAVARPSAPVTWLIISMSIIVVTRHRKNIQRLANHGWRSGKLQKKPRGTL